MRDCTSDSRPNYPEPHYGIFSEQWADVTMGDDPPSATWEASFESLEAAIAYVREVYCVDSESMSLSCIEPMHEFESDENDEFLKLQWAGKIIKRYHECHETKIGPPVNIFFQIWVTEIGLPRDVVD